MAGFRAEREWSQRNVRSDCQKLFTKKVNQVFN